MSWYCCSDISYNVLLTLLCKCAHHVSTEKWCDGRVSSEKEHLFVDLDTLQVEQDHNDDDDSVLCCLCRTIVYVYCVDN